MLFVVCFTPQHLCLYHHPQNDFKVKIVELHVDSVGTRLWFFVNFGGVAGMKAAIRDLIKAEMQKHDR